MDRIKVDGGQFIMARVQYVPSNAPLPTSGKYVLVKYGGENGLARHSRGLTITVDKSMDANLLEAHTETVIGEALAVADQEGIETVFVTTPKRPPGSGN
jgi:hypothetical protein